MTTLQKTFALLLMAVSLVLIYFLQPILAPFLAGIVLGYLGDPIVDRLETYKLPRSVGVIVVFLVFGVIIGAAVLVILPLVVGEFIKLIRDIPAALAWLQQTASPFLVAQFGVDPFDVKLDTVAARIVENWQEAGGVVGTILSQVTHSGFAFLAAVGVVGLTPVVAFYIMRDWDDIVLQIREIVPREMEPTFVRLCTECDEVLGAFLRGQLLIMCLLGCIYAIGLYMVGLDLAILIGMLSGLASIVPYLGFFVGIIAATLAALFQFQEPIYLLYVAMVFAVGQALEGWVLTPWLVGDKIGLHPVAVIFAVLAGGQLFGFVGILLALPVAAVIMVFVRHLLGSYIRSDYYFRSDDSG
ncbi:MAG: AI-2E family transporter [Pseudomonadales bacterium]|nr:AI-2E family transporter [Pseudomonadales bacterium]MBO6563965.1 AI-2E family transporter [Pseudomonadales bacterium]MBO6596060.1 AI-2E family transporter [Pseudomonadales bacterium]MBO6656400.1 AI-2E family transporter [Pseudomonadales bacterium]MBO6702680.1 AI-2E family transporter [Pseudomonadales bacterium]